MAPKVKVSLSKGEASAPKIPLNKDLMNQLIPSTSDKTKGQLIPRGPQIVEGLFDRRCSIRDAKLPYTRWELFYSWFRNKNMGIPIGNPWNYDLGKLICSKCLYGCRLA